jgi:hypothetical protein
MLASFIIVLGSALIPFVVGLCPATPQKYLVIPQFIEPSFCVPVGFYQAQDLGHTNTTDLITRCEAQCTSVGSCVAYVGQLQKAGDSTLYTGQCYYYSTVPTAPVACADHPTILLAKRKDNVPACFASSTAAATSFCSSYLSIGTVTSYTLTLTLST